MKRAYLVSALAAMMIVLAACGGNSSGEKTPANSTNTEATNVQQTAATEPGNAELEQAAVEEPAVEPEQKEEEPKEEEPKEEAAKEEIHKPKDKFTLGDWEVTLDSFEFNQKVSSDMFSSSADEGNKFIVLNFSVTNNGKEAESFTNTFGGVDVQALFKDEYEYNSSRTMLDGDIGYRSIKPLSTKKGFVVIEVPDSVAESTESLLIHLKDDKNKATIVLR
ncbi:DUF5067 domain-containing protein [Paenibacillus yanchengensis]|uniref:DUF5067 domain-containing protein n=1 Tax=Paenibacillus yanchengensis TaxID=2035833 RepID=A0ABW4YLH0_9BACL